tara:strand:+ start:63 stop:389 length:327 start_codon:yes stop_codon:yes gene_type:complete
MAKKKSNNIKKDIIENVKEKASEFVEETKDALDIAKEKLNETLSDENIKKVKQQTGEFASETQEALENLKENASELISKAVDHLPEFIEDAKEVTEKSKIFFQKLFKK